MSYSSQNIPTIRQGNEMIAFMSGKDVSRYFDGSMDNASLEMWYQEDPMNNHLGLMTYWNKQRRSRSLSLFDNLLTERSVIEVNGEDGSFTYDVEVERDTGCYVEEDGTYQHNAGIDGSIFYVTLNREFAPGTVLTYDDQDGMQFIIYDGEEEVEPTGTGGFKHPVQLVTNNKRASFPTQYLAKGTEYFVVSHASPEYGTKLAKVEMPSTPDTQRFEFRLGSVSGTETWVTATADRKSLKDGVLTASSEQYRDKLLDEMDRYGLGEFLVRMDLGANGKPNYNSANIGSTLEYLTKRELHKLMGTKLMFQRAATIKSGNGVIHLNEGLWRQIQRGYTIEYGYEIKREHISLAAEYVFQNSDVHVRDRNIKFKCGTYAYENVLEIFKEEVTQQLSNASSLLGNDMLIPNPVSGPLDSLELKPATFKKVFLPTIGNVEIELDTSLDYGGRMDRFARGSHQHGKSWTAYSMIIWDASSSEYSNRGQGLPEGTSLVENGNSRANVYLVKPEGEMFYSGRDQGRYSDRSNSDILASYKYRGVGYWTYCSGDIWVKDPSKFVTIQLNKQARKGFN